VGVEVGKKGGCLRWWKVIHLRRQRSGGTISGAWVGLRVKLKKVEGGSCICPEGGSCANLENSKVLFLGGHLRMVAR